MKQYFLMFCLTLFSLNSHARSGPYLGVDMLIGSANHEYHNQQNNADALNGTNFNAESFGYGISAGFKGKTPLGFIIAQEVFFDQLNITASNSDKGARDELTVNNRFGTKVKFGYQLTQTFDVIADLGISAVDYDNRSSTSGESHGSTKAALLYGIGIYYNINPALTLRAHYDYQALATRYLSAATKDELSLRVARVGFMLNF